MSVFFNLAGFQKWRHCKSGWKKQWAWYNVFG